MTFFKLTFLKSPLCDLFGLIPEFCGLLCSRSNLSVVVGCRLLCSALVNKLVDFFGFLHPLAVSCQLQDLSLSVLVREGVTMERKKLLELKVNELRDELEKRNLEKTGVKQVLQERLRESLEKEGSDPETYTFQIHPSPPETRETSSTNAASLLLQFMQSQAERDERRRQEEIEREERRRQEDREERRRWEEREERKRLEEREYDREERRKREEREEERYIAEREERMKKDKEIKG